MHHVTANRCATTHQAVVQSIALAIHKADALVLKRALNEDDIVQILVKVLANDICKLRLYPLLLLVHLLAGVVCRRVQAGCVLW